MSGPRTITEQVDACRAGTHPRLVARLPSGWAVMGPSQRLRGYCLLLADPIVASLNDLDAGARARFLDDMARIGDAILAACSPRRLNYEMLGNLDPTLHAHIIPRYEDEPAERRAAAIWSYPPAEWDSPEHRFDAPRHDPLRQDLARRIERAHASEPPSWQIAASLAARLHQGQTRKDGRTPYAAHTTRVALTVRDLFGCSDPDVLAAALLHDAIEDTSADFDEVAEAIGAPAAHLVRVMTKDMRMPEDQREAAYDRELADADWRAHLLKLADVYDNLSDALAGGQRVPRVVDKARRALVIAERSTDRPEVALGAAHVRALLARADRA